MHVELRDEARDDLVEGAIFYGKQSSELDQYFLRMMIANPTKPTLRTDGSIIVLVSLHLPSG